VALLLFELGNIVAITDDVTSTLRIYDKAIEYGFESEVLTKRYAKFKKMQAGLDNEYTKSTNEGSAASGSNSIGNFWTWVGALVLTLFIVSWIVLKRSNK
jgi:hypothetical protein